MDTQQELPESTTVCIVGAGPSGLACALGLAAQNVPFVIVDALAAGQNGSRAMGVHASGMEALHGVAPALAGRLVAAGIPTGTFRTMDLYEREISRIDLGVLAPYTRFPFMLVLPQHKFEAEMRGALAQPIHWARRVVGLRETPDGRAYALSFEDGQVLRATYVVAADGSNSTVRQLAGIRYLDPHTSLPSAASPADPQFVVADVRLRAPVPPNIPADRVQVMISAGGMVLSAPLRTNPDGPHDAFRLYFAVPGPGAPPRAPDAAYLQALLAARGPGSHTAAPVPQIAHVLHSARYRTRSALAERFVVRPGPGPGAAVVLIGDAAHKHGPAGGQGMGLGIADGCALAGAIADDMRAGAGPGDALEAYAQRRRAVARGVIAVVENIMEAERGRQDWVSWARMYAFWALAKLPFVRRALAWRISGLANVVRASRTSN